MADQNKIDATSLQIAELIDKARTELIADLVTLGKEIDNNAQFVAALNDLDISDTLTKKISKAVNLYTVAHRDVLESTIGFEDIPVSTLTSYISLNQQVLDTTVINTVAAHIKNEVAKGVLSGVPAEVIAQSVASASISTSQMETLVNTTLNSYSRTITNSMMEVAPANTKYVYIGPVDEKTRPECIQMSAAGRKTKAEIKSEFKKFGDILTLGGGFNCRHKWEIASDEGSVFHRQKEAKEKLNA